MAALVHAVLPFLFEKTASRMITSLYGRMVTHRRKEDRVPAAATTGIAGQ